MNDQGSNRIARLKEWRRNLRSNDPQVRTHAGLCLLMNERDKAVPELDALLAQEGELHVQMVLLSILAEYPSAKYPQQIIRESDTDERLLYSLLRLWTFHPGLASEEAICKMLSHHSDFVRLAAIGHFARHRKVNATHLKVLLELRDRWRSVRFYDREEVLPDPVFCCKARYKRRIDYLLNRVRMLLRHTSV